MHLFLSHNSGPLLAEMMAAIPNFLLYCQGYTKILQEAGRAH
jgi:hypothetical protein